MQPLGAETAGEVAPSLRTATLDRPLYAERPRLSGHFSLEAQGEGTMRSLEVPFDPPISSVPGMKLQTSVLALLGIQVS